jgi:hypothetical protein
VIQDLSELTPSEIAVVMANCAGKAHVVDPMPDNILQTKTQAEDEQPSSAPKKD